MFCIFYVTSIGVSTHIFEPSKQIMTNSKNNSTQQTRQQYTINNTIQTYL